MPRPKTGNAHRPLGFACLLIFGAMAFSTARGFNFPLDWAEAQWLINYDTGFVRRGLPGASLKWLLEGLVDTQHWELLIAILSTAILCVITALTAYIGFRILNRTEASNSGLVITLAFATSPYLVMGAHLNGYFDHVTLFLVIAALFLFYKKRVTLSAVLISIAVLCHETVLIVGYPTVLFAALLYGSISTGTTPVVLSLKTRIRKYWPLLALPVASFALICIHRLYWLDADFAMAHFVAYIDQFEFVEHEMHEHVPVTLMHNYDRHLASRIDVLTNSGFNSRAIFHATITLAPCFYFCCLALRGSRAANILIGFLLATLVFPWALHVIAWDADRISYYPVIVAYLSIWVICESPQNRTASVESPILIYSGLCAIAMNIYLQTPLMAGHVERFSAEQRMLLFMPITLAGAYFLFRHRSDLETQK